MTILTRPTKKVEPLKAQDGKLGDGIAFSGHLPKSLEMLLAPRTLDWIHAEIRWRDMEINRLRYKLSKCETAFEKEKNAIHYIIRRAQTLLDTRRRYEKIVPSLKVFYETKVKELHKLLKRTTDERNYARKHYIDVSMGHYQIKLRIGWAVRRVWQVFKNLKSWLKKRLEKRYYFANYKNLLKKLKELKEELNNLQEAFEYHIADWVEFMNDNGLPADEIVSARRQFDRLMYWKPKETNKRQELIYTVTELKKPPPAIDLDEIMRRGDEVG